MPRSSSPPSFISEIGLIPNVTKKPTDPILTHHPCRTWDVLTNLHELSARESRTMDLDLQEIRKKDLFQYKDRVQETELNLTNAHQFGVMRSPDRKQFGPFHAVLSNGLKMPMLGLGTSHSGGYSHSAVVYALKYCGYRLIDTAKRYGCEELLQQAVKESSIPRDELFLTTKLWPTDYGFESTKAAFHGSQKRLGTDYLDLFMMHWPEVPSSCSNRKKLLEETWRALEVLYDADLCHSIGVSNYQMHDLEELLENCSVSPHVNQIEFHPYQNPQELRRFCDQHRIQFQGYCPLGKGKILNEAPVVEVAERHGKTPAQILIRWSIQNGVVTIPKSTKPHRVLENSEVFDFLLSTEDMKILSTLHDGRRYVDGTNIQAKIDSNLPDGYKLYLATTPVEEKPNYRIHS